MLICRLQLPRGVGNRLCDGGPVGLCLTEDDQGWGSADCWSCALRSPVLEIRDPEDWIDLCVKHPLEVLRRSDWRGGYVAERGAAEITIALRKWPLRLAVS